MRRLLLTGVLLAGCTQEKAPPEAPASEQAAPQQPEQAPAPPAAIVSEANLPAAPDGGITVDGWGPIRIGMTLDELNAAVGEKLDPRQDPSFEEYQCTFLEPKAAPEGVSVMYSRGKVARIDVSKPGVATYGGLQVGATAAKAREVLGAALNAEPHFYSGAPSEYLTVWTLGGPRPAWNGPPPELLAALDASRGVRFETDDKGVIDTFYAGGGAIELVEGCL